jgi:hypothetical protein
MRNRDIESSEELWLDDDPLLSTNTILLERHTALLSAILKVANALPNPPEVFRDLILDLIFSTTSADRAAIILATGPEDDLTCISSRDRKGLRNQLRPRGKRQQKTGNRDSNNNESHVLPSAPSPWRMFPRQAACQSKPDIHPVA